MLGMQILLRNKNAHPKKILEWFIDFWIEKSILSPVVNISSILVMQAWILFLSFRSPWRGIGRKRRLYNGAQKHVGTWRRDSPEDCVPHLLSLENQRSTRDCSSTREYCYGLCPLSDQPGRLLPRSRSSNYYIS